MQSHAVNVTEPNHVMFLHTLYYLLYQWSNESTYLDFVLVYDYFIIKALHRNDYVFVKGFFFLFCRIHFRTMTWGSLWNLYQRCIIYFYFFYTQNYFFLEMLEIA